jgi:GNAT superfamily N-acetyltransferase
MVEVLVSVYRLRQSSPDDLVRPRKPVPRTSLIRIAHPTVDLARFLYATVGESWGWRSRLRWTHEQWCELLDDPCTETWMSWQYGQPTGYAELTADPLRDTVRINYLGLLPGFHGRRLGAQLVWDVTRRAWTFPARRPGLRPVGEVELSTRSLDSPNALRNYRARGFTVVDQETTTYPDAVLH